MCKKKQQVAYLQIYQAIDVIHKQTEIAKKNEPDDFDYSVLRQLDCCAQRALWHLTRGEQGEKNHLEIGVKGKRSLLWPK